MTKPWVNAEIDAAFVRRVAGVSKLIALRCGVGVQPLSLPGGQLSPEFREGSDDDFEKLVADIHGVGLKPSIGLTQLREGRSGWSRGMVERGRHRRRVLGPKQQVRPVRRPDGGRR